METESRGGLAGRIVEQFLDSQLSVVVLIAALAVGGVALLTTSREEEPQIVVPIADVHVEAPGLSVEEVERLVATPLERLLFQIDGVEHVYSFSREGGATVVVRFFVGEDREDSMTKLAARIEGNRDLVPPGVTSWIVKPIEIDDVATITVTLTAADRDGTELRRIGEEVLARLESLPDISRSEVIGGAGDEVVVEPDAAAMAARGISLDGLRDAIRGRTTELPAGAYERSGREVPIVTGARPTTAAELAQTIVAVRAGASVHLGEVANVRRGPGETTHLVRLRRGPAFEHHALRVLVPPPVADTGRSLPAVTLSISKKKGTNAVTVAEDVIEELTTLVRSGVVPEGVGVVVSRDLGQTADAKVDELVEALWVAIATVVGLVALVLGFREGLIVAVAVPVTFGLALFVNELFGYTINRVTLFALILSLGLVVDDPIVDVENVSRHLRRRGVTRRDAVLDAINEVRPPIILATLAVIVSFLPMFFITGMMGPYMRPMAVNVPLAMLFSMVVAFTMTPWMSYRLLRAEDHGDGHEDAKPGFVVRTYERMMGRLLGSRRAGTLLLVAVGLMLVGAAALPALGVVPLKMLPFDNKNEFQILVDLPDGSSLARADATVRRLEERLARMPEVSCLQSYVGVPSPLDFNGLVRHTYFRRSPNLGDIRVNLAPKERRSKPTHELVLSIRRELEVIAAEEGARISILETPPGPPVISTITVEVRGGPDVPLGRLEDAASSLAARLGRERGVVDVDVSTDDPHERLRVRLNEEKAARSGVAAADVAAVLRAAHSGAPLGALRDPNRRTPIPVVVRLPRERRSGEEELRAIPIAGRAGVPVRVAEIASVDRETAPGTIAHKDLERVVYVFAETAGRAPAEVILAVQADLDEATPGPGVDFEWAGEGEWQVTLDVFRDLGLAFGAALLLIYVLLLRQLDSYSIPLVVMSSIPLTMIGIFPGFALLNVFADHDVGGFGAPVYFTATAMIGMIALAGIVVRNAIILIEFVHQEEAAGGDRRGALLRAGAVRLRPVLMTAGTTLLGAWPITLDPIFSGLAWALIFGLLASTAFTLVVVPVAYWKAYGTKTAVTP